MITVLKVKKIVELVGIFNGVVRPTMASFDRSVSYNLVIKLFYFQENFTIIKKGQKEATDELFTMDELYVALEGRHALRKFKGEII